VPQFVEMSDKTVVKLWWTVRGANLDVAAAIDFSALAQGGWFAVGTSPNNNGPGDGMVGADIVIGYVDRITDGFGYMAGMTAAGQFAPTIKNPFKPTNARIGVSSASVNNKLVDDLEVMEFTIAKSLWGNGNPVSLIVSYRSADPLFNVTRAPVPTERLQSGKHTDRIRIDNFDFDTRSTCDTLPQSLQPYTPIFINGIEQVDTNKLCPKFRTGTFDMTAEFGTKLSLSWAHRCDELITDFTLVGETDGWMGIGFSDRGLGNAKMVGAELYMFSADQRTFLNGAPPGTVNAAPLKFRTQTFQQPNPQFSFVLSSKLLTVTFSRAWFATERNHSSLASIQGLTVLAARHSTARSLTIKHDTRKEISTKLFLFDANAPVVAPPPTTPRPGAPPPTTAAPVAEPNPCVADPKGSFSNKITVSAQGTPVKVDWTIDCSAKKIKFAVSADNDGWVAVGFNDKAEMPGTDTYQGSVDSSAKVIVRNGFAEGYDILQDATVAGATGKRVGKTVTVEFERPLTVAGSKDRSITFEKLLVVNVAVGSSNTFTAQHAKRGSSKPVQFFTTGDPFNPPKGGPAPTTTAANDDDDEGTDAAPGNGDPCANAKTLNNKADIKFPNGDTVDINYVIDCVAKTIEFTVTGASKGWLAIGFNEESGKMSGTDVYQLGVVDGTFKVRNGHTEGRSLLEDNFIDGASGSVSGGTVTGTFKRKLDTGTADDREFKPNLPWILLAARSNSAAFTSQHSDRVTSKDKIDFFKGGSSAAAVGGAPLVLLHGLLMLIAWLAISAVATFIARYLKDLGHGWYLMHRGLMTIVVVATFIGFILITIHVGADGVHYGSPHAVIGVLVVMFSIVQPLIGILSNRWWSPNRNGTPVFPDVVHWWLGRIVIALGFINCLLGILLFNADQASGAMILFLIWVVVIIVYTALGQKFIGAIHHNSTPFDKEPQKVDVAAWRNISMVLLAAGIVASIVMILLLAFTAPF
jgi:hypothetical protein